MKNGLLKIYEQLSKSLAVKPKTKKLKKPKATKKKEDPNLEPEVEEPPVKDGATVRLEQESKHLLDQLVLDMNSQLKKCDTNKSQLTQKQRQIYTQIQSAENTITAEDNVLKDNGIEEIIYNPEYYREVYIQCQNIQQNLQQQINV